MKYNHINKLLYNNQINLNNKVYMRSFFYHMLAINVGKINNMEYGQYKIWGILKNAIKMIKSIILLITYLKILLMLLFKDIDILPITSSIKISPLWGISMMGIISMHYIWILYCNQTLSKLTHHLLKSKAQYLFVKRSSKIPNDVIMYLLKI